MKNTTYLILCTKKSQREDTQALAHALQKQQKQSVIITTPSACPTNLPATARCIDIHDHSVTPAFLPETSLKKNLLQIGVIQAMALWKKIKNTTSCAQKIYKKYNPAALITFDDRIPCPEMVFLKLANQHKIPSLLLPFATSSVESVVILRHHRAYNPNGWHPLKYWVRKKHPQHIIRFNNQLFLFFTPWQCLALAAHRLLHINPWIIGGGDAKKIGVFNKTDQQSRIEEGTPPEKIIITGQAALDELYENKKNQHPNTIIAAVPHLAEQGLTNWETQQKITLDIVTAAHQAGKNLILSLHPKSNPQTYQNWVKDHPNVTIATQPLKTILPHADLFIASYSSTIRWAVMLGIPSIIYDPTHMNYDIYQNLVSVPVTKTAADLIQAVKNPSTPEQTLQDGQKLGEIDGKACQRILSALENLTA